MWRWPSSEWQPTAPRAVGFYDAFATHLLADFAHGNPRIESAIIHALYWLPRHTRKVLDIGCGIGWSSWEIKRHHSGTDVVGIDLSPRMVELASSLFAADGLTFRSADVGTDSLPQGRFDAIVMLDVYEHVPRDRREDLHRHLAEVLAEESRLILTVPSVSHQQRLRSCEPNQLQPVDEDVSLEDLERLARDLDARLRMADEVSIWNPGDYIHAVVERGTFAGRPALFPRRAAHLAPRRVRAALVRQALSARVTRDGVMLRDHGQVTVCIVSPNHDAYSETFIRAHIERLPARVEFLCGGWLPTQTGDGTPLLSPGLFGRALRRAVCRTLRWPQSEFHERVLCRFFRTRKVEVVLAEYGPTGVAVMRACHRAGVPLVVHFHGFDAYERETLATDGRKYAALFGSAAAVVAVSSDMEQRLIELGAPREKVVLNPYGVDTATFSASDPSQAPPVFVAVGRFVEKKAPYLTLLAFKQVIQERPDARLVMAGDGPLLGSCQQLARGLGIDDRVKFSGAIPQPDVAALMARARAFVQHSVTAPNGDSEGLPVAVLEAGASSLPVIATRHTGIPEAVVEGETGLLVDEFDVDGMAERMILLAADPVLAARLGRAARARVEQHFSMEGSINGLVVVLRNAAGARRSARSR
jgi:colanic acid/amylovoran biosynthesis glycosyltransferase